jgi:hypothetical protein
VQLLTSTPTRHAISRAPSCGVRYGQARLSRAPRAVRRGDDCVLLATQHDILNTMTSYISSLVATKATSLVEVGQVVHDLLPLLVLNINEASADQVDQLYATMEKWRAATIAPADWETLRVIVTASHMARRQSIVAQVGVGPSSPA